jgi:tetratricopeptide (TPR) repeat protein
MARVNKSMTNIVTSASRTEKAMLRLSQNHRTGLSRIEGVIANLQATGHDVRASHFVSATNAGAIHSSPREVATLYLYQQVKTITDSLERLASTTVYAQDRPSRSYLAPLKPTIIAHSSITDPSAYHRQGVSAALEIIHILEDGPDYLSVQSGAWNMINFAIRLHGLEMYADAVAIGTWAVQLYRMLVSTNAPVYEPYLALALRNLSKYQIDVGDNDKAEDTIGECVKRQRALLHTLSSNDICLELSNSLIALWSIYSAKGEVERGLIAAQESLSILEDIRVTMGQKPLCGETYQPPGTLNSTVMFQQPLAIIDSFSTMLLYWDDDVALWLEFNTARASYGVSCSLYDLGRHSEALELGGKALDTLSDLSERYPGVFDADLAGCLAHLSRPAFNVFRSIRDTVSAVEKAVQIYRRLCTSRQKQFATSLVETLWQYATLLNEAGDPETAKSIAAEAVEIVRCSQTDRMFLADALNHSSWILRHMNLNEAAVALRREVVDIYRDLLKQPSTNLLPEILADTMCDLSSDLHFVEQLDDAIVVCEEAVEIYRSVVGSHGSRSHKAGLAMALSYLTHTLNTAEMHDSALQAGTEALDLYRELIRDETCFIHHFLVTLRRTSFAACYSDNSQAPTRSAQIIRDYHTLAVHHRQDVRWGLINAYKDRDFILGKQRQAYEALLNSEELAKTVRSISLDTAEAAVSSMDGLSLHAGNLAHAGRIKEAILLCEEAISIGRQFHVELANVDRELDLSLADTLYQYSQCLRVAGRNKKALAASEEIVTIYRRYAPDDDAVCRLREHSINLGIANRFMEAIELGQEAVRICRTTISTAVLADLRLPYALESLSTCLADSGDEDHALTVIEEAVGIYRDKKSTHINTWAYAEVLYADALMNLACRSMAKGIWDVVEPALSEARNIYQGRVLITSGCYPALAMTLDLMAVYFCAVGRHNDSVLAAQDLADRQIRLATFDPQLAMLVQIALDDLRTSPSQQALRRNRPVSAMFSN